MTEVRCDRRFNEVHADYVLVTCQCGRSWTRERCDAITQAGNRCRHGLREGRCPAHGDRS
jgi:hypothetical protein